MTIFDIGVRIAEMKNFDSLYLYASTVLSLMTIAVLFILMKMLEISKKRETDSAFSLLIRACIITGFIIIFSSMTAALLKTYLVLNAGLFINSLIFAVILFYSLRVYVRNIKESEEKEERLKADIAHLKDLPSERLEQVENVIVLSGKLLNKTASLLINKKDVTNEVYASAAAALKTELHADGAVILIANVFDNVFAVKALTGEFPPPYKLPEDVPHKEDHVFSNFKHAEFRIDEASIFGKTALGVRPIVVLPEDEEGLLPQNGDEPFLRHGSSVFFPLVSGGRIMGIAAVSRSFGKEPFERHDIDLGKKIAGYIGEMINLITAVNDANESAEIENITDTASKVQKLLLPKNLKKNPALDIGEYFLQARGICSDYYDVIVQQNRIFIVVADIAGKSIQSAVVMVMLRAILYLITNTNQSTEAILDWLNKGITGKIDIDHFASISLLCYEPEKKSLEFIGAGNQAMLLYKAGSKKAEIFQQKTDPIGVDVRSSYKSRVIPLEKGDTVLLYTDGVIECLNSAGEPYGVKRLATVTAENFDKPSRTAAEKIKADVQAFLGRALQRDDHTVLVIKAR